MFCRLSWWASVLLVLLAACQRPKPSSAGPAGIAILPFENLTGDARLDWLPAGIQHVLVAQCGPKATTAITAPGELRTALLAGARMVWHGSLSPGHAGRVRVDLTREDRATQQLTSEPPVELPLDAGLFPALTALARRIGGNEPGPSPTNNLEALQEFTAGRATSDPAVALSHHERATQLDSRFTGAWLARAEAAATLRQPELATRLLDEFQTRVPDAPEVDKAQAALIAGRLKGDQTAVGLALKRLAEASPWNTGVQATAANLFATLRWPQETLGAYTRLSRIDPASGDTWNKVAYARAGVGDLAGARQAIEEYRRLEPAEMNVLDSLGEIEYQFGNFRRAAELFLETHQKNPAFNQGAGLGKAAYAKLMEGDVKAADALFERLLAHRKVSGQPGAELLRADWLFQSGRRQQALAKIEAIPVDAAPALRAAFETEACLMHAAAGGWEKAAAAAERAIATGAPSGRALVCAFLSQPAASSDEWTRRAGRMFPDPAQRLLRTTALAYALALRGHCPAAMAPLREVFQATDPAADGEPRTLLAHCTVQTKQWEGLKALFTRWPQPPTQEPLFTPLVFPFQIAVRTAVAAHYEDKPAYTLARQLYEAYAR